MRHKCRPKRLLGLLLVVVLTLVVGCKEPHDSSASWTVAWVNLASDTLADTSTAYLMTVHFIPPILAGINGTDFTIRNESFAQTGTLPWCSQVFAGAGVPDKQTLYVTITPIKWDNGGVSGSVGYNQTDHPDTLMFEGPSTGPFTDTLTYKVSRSPATSDTIDPFAGPFADWGHDPDHPTSWKAQASLPHTAFAFTPVRLIATSNCPNPF